MATYTVSTNTFNGQQLALVAVTASDYFINDGHTVVQVNNAGSSSCDVTFKSAQLCSQGFEHDVTIAVAAGTTEIVGPFPVNRFNDSNNGITVNYSEIVSVSASAYRINY
jgi:hypothetical protein